jgi:hypothetical protein
LVRVARGGVRGGRGYWRVAATCGAEGGAVQCCKDRAGGGGRGHRLLRYALQEEEHPTHDPRRSRLPRGAGAIVAWTRCWSGGSARGNQHSNCDNENHNDGAARGT